MTSKERAYLRSMANTMDPVVYIGKEGVTDGVKQTCWEALEARELIKVALQKNAPYANTREACGELCEAVHAEPVQCIGLKFVVYRPARKGPHLLDEMGKE